MKRLILIIIIPLLSFTQEDIFKIKNVLSSQESSWNEGDIHNFMLGYWNSDMLEFSSEDVITYGWTNTYIKYKKSYPTKEKMGKLQFDIIDIKLTSDTTAIVNGKWELVRVNNKPWGGGFILTFQKFNNEWLIIKDYTTSN